MRTLFNKERQKQRNHMLPEQYRYLVWQLALLSSGRRWLSLPFDKMQSKRANKHTSAPARSARWLRILESFSILFWFECFSCLFFFPTYSASSRDNRLAVNLSYITIFCFWYFSQNIYQGPFHTNSDIFKTAYFTV